MKIINLIKQSYALHEWQFISFIELKFIIKILWILAKLIIIIKIKMMLTNNNFKELNRFLSINIK